MHFLHPSIQGNIDVYHMSINRINQSVVINNCFTSLTSSLSLLPSCAAPTHLLSLLSHFTLHSSPFLHPLSIITHHPPPTTHLSPLTTHQSLTRPCKVARDRPVRVKDDLRCRALDWPLSTFPFVSRLPCLSSALPPLQSQVLINPTPTRSFQLIPSRGLAHFPYQVSRAPLPPSGTLPEFYQPVECNKSLRYIHFPSTLFHHVQFQYQRKKPNKNPPFMRITRQHGLHWPTEQRLRDLSQTSHQGISPRETAADRSPPDCPMRSAMRKPPPVAIASGSTRPARATRTSSTWPGETRPPSQRRASSEGSRSAGLRGRRSLLLRRHHRRRRRRPSLKTRPRIPRDPHAPPLPPMLRTITMRD